MKRCREEEVYSIMPQTYYTYEKHVLIMSTSFLSKEGPTLGPKI